jgi:hypothetical protein
MNRKEFQINFIAILSLFVLSYSCEKQPEPEPESKEVVMPPLTHTGANTFGCYIDGELFVANDGESIWSIPAVSGSFDEQENILLLQGTRYLEGIYLDDIRIQIVEVNEPGSYRLYSIGSELRGYVSSGSDNCDYYYDMSNYGHVELTFLDKSKNIISGTFSMNLINSECS